MRYFPRHLGFCSWTVLLVLGAACSRAEFVAVADGAAGTGDVDEASVIYDTSDAGNARGLDTGDEAGITCTAPSVPSCPPSDAGICDPVCQTGGCNWCAQKCSYVLSPAGDGVEPTCTSMGKGVFPQICTVRAAGASQQSDDCAPGSICLAPTIGDSLTYCFDLCRSQADCPYGVGCGQRKLSAAGGLVSVCDPPYDQCGVDGTCCDPLANSGCATNRTCLLVSPDLGSGHSRTVCEFAYGDGRNGSPCVSARDCQIRNTCVNNTCQQVCNDATACPAGELCFPLGSEFGYCS